MRIQLLSSILVCGVLLCGCAGGQTLILRNKDGVVVGMKTKGAVRTIITEGDKTYEQDSKQEPWISLKPELVGGKVGI